jgi:hypothetical protein
LQSSNDQGVTNPSDVVVAGMKLPLQRIVRPVREIVLHEAAAAAGVAVESIDADALLCGNPLFQLQPEDDAPEELVHYPDEEYRP